MEKFAVVENVLEKSVGENKLISFMCRAPPERVKILIWLAFGLNLLRFVWPVPVSVVIKKYQDGGI